jgi:DNA-binding transcriptional LysR family regulator
MIDRLEYLLALARERHFGRAAVACGVSQPTLSAGIKQLEESFGAMLVERGSRFRGFTAAGQIVLDGARRIVADHRAMHQEVTALRHALSGGLKIAAIPTAIPLLTRLTVPFAERHPSVQVTCLSRTSDEVLTLLENLEVDAGVTYLDQEPLRRVVAVPLHQERFRYVCARGMAQAGRASIAWRELATAPLCLLTPDMQNRRIIDRALAEAGAAPVVALQSDSMLSLLAHLRTGRWSSILPDLWLASLGLGDDAALLSIPLTDPDIVSVVGLVVPDREPMSVLTQALLAQATRLNPDP